MAAKLTKTQKNIKENIHEEQEAITGYGKAAKQALKDGLKSTAKLLTHIQSEERHHKAELTRATGKVAKQLAGKKPAAKKTVKRKRSSYGGGEVKTLL